MSWFRNILIRTINLTGRAVLPVEKVDKLEDDEDEKDPENIGFIKVNGYLIKLWY